MSEAPLPNEPILTHPQADSCALPDHLRCLLAISQALTDPAAGPVVGIALVGLECVNRIDGMLGYRAGDSFCTQITHLLLAALKPGDEVFRVGRNELVCLLRRLPSEAHAVLAAHKILRTLDARLSVEDNQMHANPSVGIALSPSHSQDADILLRQANAAMHEAKHQPDRYALYDMRFDEPRRLQLQLQAALRDAIDDNLLELRYQPKLDLRSNQIIGAEALVRWNHPQKGSISPSQFIPVAEASGLISSLSLKVLNSALYQFASMQARTSDLCVAVNLSAYDLLENDLPAIILQALNTWNFPASRLILEITETAVMEDSAAYRTPLEQLKETGIRLSIDDFGTGYSSMTRLRNLPVDELKIDLSFIQNMLTSSADAQIVESMIGLAHGLGIRVVAEGVENQAIMQRLVELECDVIQGYHISRPLPAEEFASFVELHNASVR